MNMESIQFAGANGTVLPGRIWTGDDAPRMVLQVTHGMTEHMGRYQDLARQLTTLGIAVAGFDLRGHGLNPGDQVCASFGEGGWDDSLEDMHRFHGELARRFPGLPHFMLGFSLGSFLLRDFIGRFHDEVVGAVIMGTGHQPGLVLSVLLQVIRGEIKRGGFDHSTPRVQEMSFGNYNKRFAPNQPPFDWLCSDQEQLALYARDALCRREISAGLFWQLVDAMRRTGRPDTYRGWDPNLPVLLLSGAEDPVGDCGKGVLRVQSSMKKAGLRDVEAHLLPNARHDLLHEASSGAAQRAIDLLVKWLLDRAQAGFIRPYEST